MAAYKQLVYGERSALVLDFQDALRKVVDPSVGVDGIYGPQTEQFVQKAYSMYPWLSSSARPRVAILPLVAAVMEAAASKPNSGIPSPVPLVANPPVPPVPPVPAELVIEGVRASPSPVVAVVASPPVLAKKSQGMKDSTKIAIGLGVLGLIGLLAMGLKKK